MKICNDNQYAMISILPAASEQEVHWEARAGGEPERMFVKKKMIKNEIVLLDPYSNALC